MHARVSIFEGSPEELDEGLRQAREQVLPSARQMDGFKGLMALGDRQSGKLRGKTFWESEEAMYASEDHPHQRSETTYALGQGSAPC